MENNRKPENPINELFINRWSPRSFSNKNVSKEVLYSLFEAARWSPSCFNDQPWIFLYATNDEPDIKKLFLEPLVEFNYNWAKEAPVIIYIIARKHFAHNGNINFHSGFDTGAAWMSLSLQAQLLGLSTHAMAGFDKEKAYKNLNVDKEKYDIYAVCAIGYKDEADKLPEELKLKEKPNSRRSVNEFVVNGMMK